MIPHYLHLCFVLIESPPPSGRNELQPHRAASLAVDSPFSLSHKFVSFWRRKNFTSWSSHIILIHHPALKETRGRRRGTSTYSQSALWRGMPLNLGVFSCASLFCVQAKEVHCAGRHPEKRGELGAVVCWCFCSAAALKRPEWSSAIGSSRPEPRDNATGQLWRSATIKNAASLY